MENEKLISIKTWEGIYEISNYGYVRTLPTITYGGHGKKQKIIVKQKDRYYSSIMDGYCLITLIKRPRREDYLMHRLVAQHFIPNPENKPEVNHKDGNKSNNLVSNLEWATSKENMEDAVIKGLRGSGNKRRKRLPKETVLEIFNLDMSLGELSKKYNLPKLLIQSIKTGKRRSSITGKIYNGKSH